jgi:integrase/recombinase XerD
MVSLNIGDVYSIIDGKVFESAFLTREMTKGKKQRTIVLNQQPLTDAIKDYLGERVERSEELKFDSPIFKSEQEGRFTGQTLSIVFRTMFDSVGLKRMSIHTGRRTFATRLNEQGVSIKNIQTLMGHASITTTNISIENNLIKLGEISKNLRLV